MNVQTKIIRDMNTKVDVSIENEQTRISVKLMDAPRIASNQ
jgi:uncharacterized protein YajQ (UPF0234 family)